MSQEAEQPPDAPYNCPHCGQAANQISAIQNGPLMIFWHITCRSIINVQLISMPEQAKSRIVVPGRPS